VRPRSIITLLATVAVLAGLAAAAVAAGVAPRAGAAKARYVDPLGWSIRFPTAMHLERAQSPRFVRLNVSEVTVASFPLPNPIRSGSTSTSSWMRVDSPHDPHGGFPAGGIAFRIVRSEGGPGPNVEQPESRFPLRLSTFGRGSMYPNTMPHAIGRTVVADGRTFIAQAWIGARASAEARARLAQIVSSLSFPRLRVGQTVGYGFRVFPTASHYPVGSFTHVRVQGQPFYLVHAPGGFYAVGWTWQSLSGGYKSRCEMRLDRPRKQFFCTNMRARWDRVGRVLVKPESATRGDPLNITVAKVAWDGHVLLFPGVARFAGAQYAHQLWPAAYPSR
jgi:hypothetical protein